jgi:hypothetical protein
MRLTRFVVGSILLAVSLASAQWLETTIWLPDSLGGLSESGRSHLTISGCPGRLDDSK